jgi:hypothetical protein
MLHALSEAGDAGNGSLRDETSPSLSLSLSLSRTLIVVSIKTLVFPTATASVSTECSDILYMRHLVLRRQSSVPNLGQSEDLILSQAANCFFSLDSLSLSLSFFHSSFLAHAAAAATVSFER